MTAVEKRIAALDRGFDALERGDLDSFMGLLEENCHPDCEFHSAIGTQLGGTAFTGFGGLRDWFADLLSTVDQPRWKDRTYEAVGDDAFLVFARFEMKGAASEIELDTEVGQLYELEDGLIKRGRSYISHADARAAAEALVA